MAGTLRQSNLNKRQRNTPREFPRRVLSVIEIPGSRPTFRDKSSGVQGAHRAREDLGIAHRQ